MATRSSCPRLRAIQPSLLTRIVYQVGSPTMFEGKRFFPLTGIPIWKIERSSTLFAVWEPEPLTVATWREKSLTRGFTWGGRGGAASGKRHEERRRPHAPAKRDMRG